MADAGKSPKTVSNTHGVLHRALEQAVRWSILSRNVADVVEPPRVSRPPMRTLSPEEARKVLAVAEGDELEALWRLALTTGLRQGELAALRWGQVDLERGVLQVVGTLQQASDHERVVAEPKTARGRRSVQIAGATVESLRAHRARCMAKSVASGHHDAYVFAWGDGRPYSMSMIWKRWHRLNVKAEVPLVRFHDLRHTAASLLLTRGVHPKVVQEMLGHSTIAMTLDVYSHVAPSLHREAATVMDALLSQT